jgi:flagellar basal body rod protein FlgB
MDWVSLLRTGLSIVDWLAKKAYNAQQIKAGEYKNIAKTNAKHLENLAKAKRARSSVKHDVDSVRNDRNNRRRSR